jgi:fumarate hydratase class II
MAKMRRETDSLGEIDVPADRLWGAQTQRSLEYFSIGRELMPREMIGAYAILKKAVANVNRAGGRLGAAEHRLIVQACDEILEGRYDDMFPLHVWMTGSGTQFNMNVNEVIANRCSQIAGEPLGSKRPAHPNDHVNMAQSSNDNFPSAMYIATALGARRRLIPSVQQLRDAIDAKAYGAAYRSVGRRIDRVHQVDLIDHLGHALEKLTKRAFAGTALKMMRKPAAAVGLSDLQAFLESGYNAFRAMGNASEFLEIIVSRERAVLEGLFAGNDGILAPGARF